MKSKTAFSNLFRWQSLGAISASAFFGKTSEGPPKKSVDEKEWIRIRVWNPCKVECMAGECTYEPLAAEKVFGKLIIKQPSYMIGHVSLELPQLSVNIYLSFWPLAIEQWPERLQQQIANAKKPSKIANKIVLKGDASMPAVIPRTVEEDITAEAHPADARGKRLPDTDIILFSLDYPAALAESEVQRSYALFGDGIIPQLKKTDDKKFDSCSSAAYRVLKAAGINQLSPVCGRLDSRLTPITPDSLAACVRDAKAKELILYPETAKWIDPDKSTRAEQVNTQAAP